MTHPLNSDAATAPEASTAPLRLGVVGDAAELREIVDLLPTLATDVTLTAHAGCAKAEAVEDAAWFEDRRVLLARAEIDAVLLLTAPRAGFELTRHAVQRGLHVWRGEPLARNFVEALELAKLAEDHEELVIEAGSRWREVAMAYSPLISATAEFGPSFTEISIRTPGPPLASWRSSAVDAGGGALLQDAYFALEALIALRGLPDNVSAVVGKCRRPAAGARETEDIAAVHARYEDGTLATIQAMWDLPPMRFTVAHHDPQRTLMIDADSASMRHGEEFERVVAPDSSRAAQLQRFIGRVRGSTAEANPRRVLERQVAVVALVEAAYLAVQTNQPESPRKLYEVQGWKPPQR